MNILSPVQTDATLLDVTCCVRLHTLLHVVGSCCTKFKTSQTFICVEKDEMKSNRESTMEGRGERQLSYCGSQRKDRCKLKS